MSTPQSRYSVRAELEGKTNFNRGRMEHEPRRKNTQLGSPSTAGTLSEQNSSDGTKTESDQSADTADSPDGDAQDEAEEDDPDGDALPRVQNGMGMGKGKGKGPGIRVHHVEQDSHEEDESFPQTGMGLTADDAFSSPLKRKRRESNMSMASVLEDDSEPSTYPRKKILKGLEHTDEGLLAYTNVDQAIEDSDSQADLTDDDYEGVNDISDGSIDGDNEREIELFEEANLVRFMQGDTDLAAELHDPFARESHRHTSNRRSYSDSSAKRVRFKDEDEVVVKHSRDSDSDSDSTDEEIYWPDVFNNEDAPPSAFELAPSPSDSGESHWDFEEQMYPVLVADFEAEELDEGSDSSLSGYETDAGETTEEDEDMPPPRLPASASSIVERPTSAASNNVASPSPFRRTPRPRGPRMGFFNVDPTKHVLYSDPTGKRVECEPSQESLLRNLMGPFSHLPSSASSATANSSPRASNAGLLLDESDFSESSQQVRGGPTMQGELFRWGNFYSDAELGAELGFLSPAFQFHSKTFDDDDETDEEEGDMIMSAYVDFEAGSDNEDDGDTIHPSSPPITFAREDTSTTTTPRASFGAAGFDAEAMLEHLDRTQSVTSFRNNQSRHRSAALLPADPDLRASVTKPVRSGKTAETPITPARRRGSSFQRRAEATASSPLLQRSSAAVTKSTPSRGPRIGRF